MHQCRNDMTEWQNMLAGKITTDEDRLLQDYLDFMEAKAHIQTPTPQEYQKLFLMSNGSKELVAFLNCAERGKFCP